MAAIAREENKDRPLERSYILIFKNVEDAIDKFNDDDGKSINQWIREFDDLAKLCGWCIR